MVKNYIVHIVAVSFLLLSSHISKSQCGSSTGVGGFQTLEEEFCGGEKKVWAGKSYSSVDLPPGMEVYILVDWGYAGSAEYYPTVFEFGNYVIDNTPINAPPAGALFPNDRYAYHLYPEDLEACSYIVEVLLVFVDAGEPPATSLSTIICPGTDNSASTNYWEKDNVLPGSLQIENGPIIRICEGESVTINPLNNISLYNCPLTNNTSNRWFQWIYNVDAANPIPDVNVVGLNVNETFNVGGPASNFSFEETVQLDPGPNIVTGDIDMDPTGAITIDGTNTVAGQYFDIQLNAWNICNPFDDADIPGVPSFASAANANDLEESITIRILIVSDPNLNPVIIRDASNNPKPGNKFCPEETIRIRNGGNALGPGPWTINIYDGPTTSDPLIVSYNGQNRTLDTENTTDPEAANLNSPGFKTIEAIKVNNDVSISLGCSSTIIAQYEIISTPTAIIGFDDGTFGSANITDNTYEICSSDLPIQLDFTDESGGKTVNLTTSWEINKISPNAVAIDNVNDGGGSAAPFDYPSNPLIISDTGHYRVILRIDDASTNCSSSDQFDVYIYDAPEASFTATGVCEGEDTDFNPSSSNIPTVINGDAIDTYLWDFSYDSVTFNTDFTANNNATFSQNLGPAGIYSVALIVQTAKSCISDTFLMEVEVYPNPGSDITAFYGSVFDGNAVDDPYTGDPICPGTLIKFVNNSDEFNNDPSIIDIGYALEIDSLGTTVFRTIGDSGTFAIPDIFYNTTLANLNYTVKLIAIANPADANLQNNCRVESNTITVAVLPGSASGFIIYEDDTESSLYDPSTSYCSPNEFLFKIDNLTNSTLNANDSVIWEVFDGATQLGGDTVSFGDPAYRYFSFDFNNDYPSIAPINFTINLRVFVAGFCVNPSQNTVRVLPKPDSSFVAIDTVYACDFVTYTFEANQPGLLAYNWNPQPIAEVFSSTVTNNKFEVIFNRPAILDPPLDISLNLQTINPFGCLSGISAPFEDTIQPKDNFDIVLVATGNETCIPAIYNFDNQSIPTDIPVNTKWELHVTNTLLTTVDVIKGEDLVGNEDFSNGYDYEFSQAGSFEITLKALLESNCDLSSDPPVNLTINNKPQMDLRVVNDQGCTALAVRFIDNSSNLNNAIIPSTNAPLQSVTLTVANITTGLSRPPINIPGPVAADFWNGQSIDSLRYDTVNTPGGLSFNDYILAVEGLNNEGCSDISRDTVRVFRAPLIDFQVLVPNPACEANYEFEFDVTTYSVPGGTALTWNWGDGTQTVDPSSNNRKHIYANRASFFASDQYMVTLSAQTLNGCITSVSKPVNLNPRIQANFFPDRSIGCSPLDVNFTSQSLGVGLLNNHVYKKRIKGTIPWTDFTSSPSNIGSVSERFTNSTGANIIYEILYSVSSDVGGCTDDADIREITIYPGFDSPPITGSTIVCAFEQGLDYSVPLTAGSNYIWNLPLGAFISNQNIEGNEVKVNFSNFNGNVTLTEINANGCFGNPSTLAVSVLTGPSASLVLNGPNVICPGDSTTLKFNLAGPGSAGFDVVYNSGVTNDTLLNIQNGHEIKVGPMNSTNYFLLDVTDREYPACFPTAITGSVFISVNIPPSVTLTGNSTVCEGTPTNLFFNLTGIGPWKVKYTDGTSEYNFESNSPVHLESVNPNTSVTYTPVEVTDGNSPVCSGQVNGAADIIVNQKPSAEIFGDQNNVCANAPTAIKLNLRGVAPWIVRYTNGANIFTLSNIIPAAGFDPATDVFTYSFEVSPPSGTTSYQLIDVRDANVPSCLGDISGSAVIEAFDRPVASLEGNATICKGQSTPIQFNLTGDGPFTVRYTANTDTLQANNIANGDFRNVSPETSTIYRVIDVVDIRGCISNIPSGPISVNVNQIPTAVLSGTDTICFGAQVNLIFDLTGVGPWQISYSDGAQNYNFITSFNRHFEPITPTATRTYQIISITDSNSPNCSNIGTGSPQIEVYPVLEAAFTATPEEMDLPKSDVAITNTTTNKNIWSYTWNFGDGTTSNAVDPGTHVYETYGQYIIKMTATNGLCTDTFEQLITIGAIPAIVDFVATPLEGCLPLVVEFENLTRFADPGTYQWDFGDNQRVRAVENPTHVYSAPGVYTVSLVANNITGQEREVIKEAYITVFETPQASFTIPDAFRQVFTGEPVQFVNTSLRADEFIWKFGDGNQSFDENPVHVYPDSGIFDITVIAINSTTGCEDSFKLDAQVKVILGGDSKIANAFTPSRSGPGSASGNVQSNDIFLPQLKGVSTFDMKVYNRWGELLFETKDKNIGWDGYYKNQLMPQGVYVYRLELIYDNGRRETKVGDITLIR